MMQQPEPDDYVLATGRTNTVKEFTEAAFAELDLDSNNYVKTDTRYDRPSEVNILLGDASKARDRLGWQAKTNMSQLVKLMIDSDMVLARKEYDNRVR